MPFESAQTNFQGQQGWNDLAPDALNIAQAVKSSKGKVRPRRVVTAPPLAMSAPSIPSSTAASKASLPCLTTNSPPRTLMGPPKASTTATFNAHPIAPPKASPGPTPIVPSPSSSKIEKNISVQEVRKYLTTLAERPSNLKKLEIDATLQKLEAHYNLLSQHERVLLKEALSFAPGDKTKARKMLVDYSLIHSNVSQWTVPIRMLIDQQQ